MHACAKGPLILLEALDYCLIVESIITSIRQLVVLQLLHYC